MRFLVIAIWSVTERLQIQIADQVKAAEVVFTQKNLNGASSWPAHSWDLVVTVFDSDLTSILEVEPLSP